MPRFGLFLELMEGYDYPQVRRLALLAEELGFDSLWCSDHLFLEPGAEGRQCWECWTVLTALAVETSRLRLGSMVTCNSYRYPSLLAKMAACVDRLSGGRLEFGLGAGWKRDEYEAYGIPFPPPGERVARLEEALQVVRLLWTQDRASFRGRFYQLRDAPCQPRPVQRPHPPIWVGAFRPRAIAVGARQADWLNFGAVPTPQAFRERVAYVQGVRREAGLPPEGVRFSQLMGLITAQDRPALERRVQQVARARGKDPEAIRADPWWLIGTPEEVVERVRGYLEAGVECFIFAPPMGQGEEALRLLAGSVLPRL